jgi:hypothetical protein
MTIIYIHGVKVRSPEHGEALEVPFRRWLAPAIEKDGLMAEYLPVYWGDAAAKFRWDLDSRPRTALRGMGGREDFPALGSLRGVTDGLSLKVQPQESEGGPVLGRAAPAVSSPVTPALSSIPRERRADFLADLYLVARPDARKSDVFLADPPLARLAAVAADVAGNWENIVASQRDDAVRVEMLMHAVETKLGNNGLIAQGGLADWMVRAGEIVKRAAALPGDTLSTVFAELRPVANEFVAYFIGDVLTYIADREIDGIAGEIPRRVLSALACACERKKLTGEPIIVVTHSMGGQLLYDALTYFASERPEFRDLVVDHWISCGAQVSFFAELGLFKTQPAVAKPQKLERPSNVAVWTNFYDPNDFVGFIMAPVFDGVVDIEYDTGYGLAFAHTGFLARPSFFGAMAARLKEVPT